MLRLPFGRSRPVLVAMLVAPLVLTLTGAASPQEPDVRRYVSLGDSYAAGPLIPPQTSLPVGCLRSDRNYPSLLAATLGAAEHVDVSCSGATTAGRWLVGSLMKVIPGGQIPGLAISGAVAGALTTAMGWAWVAVCERGLAAGGLQNIRAEEIQDLFSTEFKRRFKFPGRGGSAE